MAVRNKFIEQLKQIGRAPQTAAMTWAFEEQFSPGTALSAGVSEDNQVVPARPGHISAEISERLAEVTIRLSNLLFPC